MKIGYRDSTRIQQECAIYKLIGFKLLYSQPLVRLKQISKSKTYSYSRWG